MKYKKIILLVILFIIILGITALLLFNKNGIIKRTKKQAKQETGVTSLNIDIKEENDTSYKCLLTFTLNDGNDKIKSIKYPSDKEIQVRDNNGKESIAIDYEIYKTDINKTFKITTINGNEYEMKTAYKVEFDFDGGYSGTTEQYGLIGNPITLTLAPIKTDNVFVGWSDNQNATTAQYSKGASYIGGNEVEKLYAVWEERGGIVGYIAKNEVNQSGTYSIERTGITYNFDVLYIDQSNIGTYGNYNSSTNTYTITNSINLGTATESKMGVLKCDGNLSIESGVSITTSTYSITSSSGVTGDVTKVKGLFIYCSGELVNNGTITQTARGTYDTEGENVYLWSENSTYEGYTVPALGGSPGNVVRDGSGINGTDGINRQTGGGGSGSSSQHSYSSARAYSGAGSQGTSYSGGTGGRTEQEVVVVLNVLLRGKVMED